MNYLSVSLHWLLRGLGELDAVSEYRTVNDSKLEGGKVLQISCLYPRKWLDHHRGLE